MEEAQSFKSGKASLVSTQTVAETAESHPAANAVQPLDKMTVAQLKAHATMIGVQIAPGLKKKADLIACINGTYVAEPVAKVEPVNVQAELPAAPAGGFDPITGQPIQAAPAAQAVDREGLCNDIKAKYGDAQAAGITNDALNNTVGTHLQRVGCAGVKVSELPDDKLLDFHSGFTTQIASFIAHAAGQQPAQAGQGFM